MSSYDGIIGVNKQRFKTDIACCSHHLAPDRGSDADAPEDIYERPVCMRYDWTGQPVLVEMVP